MWGSFRIPHTQRRTRMGHLRDRMAEDLRLVGVGLATVRTVSSPLRSYWARTYRRLRESSGASIPVIARLRETASPMGISSCRGLKGKPWRCGEEAHAIAKWRKERAGRESFGVWKTAETVSGPPRARRGQDCS